MIGQEKISKLDIIATTMLLLMSGTIYFYILLGNVFIPLYFLFGIFYYHCKSKTIANKANVQFIILWMFYLFANYFIINPNHTAGIIPGIILSLISIGSFCIVSKLKYSVFKYLILRIVALLAFVSIIHFVLYEIGIISPMRVETNTGKFYLSFLHRHIEGQLSGMYWEPGAYQIILNFTLILYLGNLAKGNVTGREKLMICIIVLASLLTGSTASYFVLCIIVASYIIVTYRNNRITINMLLRLFLLVGVGVVAIVVMLNSSTVQDKLAQEGHENSSYDIRKNDNLALMQLVLEKPIFGWGINTEEYAARSKQLDNRTASNGPLAFTANYGIIVACIFFVIMYNNIKKFGIGLPPLIAFATIIFMISFQNFMMFPLMFTIYLRFANEQKMRTI